MAGAKRGGLLDELDAVKARHPPFLDAVIADAAIAWGFLGRPAFTSRRDGLVQALRLVWEHDGFIGLVLYRAKAHLQSRGVPVLPRILHRLAIGLAQVCIGDPVLVQPGIYIAHGQVVIDGFVEVHAGTVLFPWVTVGLKAGVFRGPTIESDVHLGSGAKVIGPITVGAGARVGANSVVLDDVPPGATVVGVPAKVVTR